MRYTLLFIALLPLWAVAQETTPEMNLAQSEVQAHVEYLASDALMGRRTGTPGNDSAAYYIARQLESFGVKPMPGQSGYFQAIRFDKTRPPAEASLTVGDQTLAFQDDFILLTGHAIDSTFEVVYADYGWIDEEAGIDHYAGLDVTGKLVITLPGIPDSKDPYAPLKAIRTKRKIAQEKGAAALMELYQIPFPWPMFKSNFVRERLSMADESEPRNELPYGFINAAMGATLDALKEGKIVKAAFSSSGEASTALYSNNVAGYLPGTDEALQSEYLLITAHFDHVGSGKEAGGRISEQDSIFNGARDNALGVSALLSAAKTLALQPTRRPVLFLAVTAEEIGLLGSEYFTEHPLVPLHEIAFNLNTDGAGYNDTGSVAVIGYGRTGTDEHFDKGAASVGLKVIPNPAPEGNLFDRSDNVSFSKMGIPSASLSPGFTGFTPEIMQHYHQVTDEADDLDFAYVLSYCKAFSHTARLIANAEETPKWVEGDKYEEVGEKLYSTNK
jgi:hypothetical protein